MKKETEILRNLRLALCLALLVLPFRAQAQFSTPGDNPARVRWSQLETDHFRVVYPRGMDSLATVYAGNLSKYRIPVSRTGTYAPGELYRAKMPVILHNFSGISNASVTWAPRRMDIYSLPDPYDPEPMSWEKSLAIHESRHVSQMQLGYDGFFRPFHWLLGHLFPSAVAAIYANRFLMEGDAVVAETGLSASGRGRSGDFLNYYMPAFDNGDWRNWYRWRYGSWRHYTPDQYAFGYLMLAGVRVFYDDPLFMDNYYGRISRNPLRYDTFRRNISRVSGKRFNDAFEEILQNYHSIWSENAARRGPFIDSRQLTAIPSWYEEIDSPEMTSAGLLALRSGMVNTRSLVAISPEGEVRELRPFAATSSDLAYDSVTDRLYWSETFRDERWALEASSRICFIDLSSGKWNVRCLTQKGRLFNPCPSPDGSAVAAVEYRPDGSCRLVTISPEDGSLLSAAVAPSGVRPVKIAWTDDEGMVLSVVKGDGMGLYAFDGEFRELLSPAPVQISALKPAPEGVVFVSDRTGVDEIYGYSRGEVRQLTATRYGADDPVFVGDSLCYTMQGARFGNGRRRGEGRSLYVTRLEDLRSAPVDFSSVYRDPVAETLSRQERLQGGEQDRTEQMVVEISGPRNYSKAAHLFRFHSWCPLKIDYDNFSAINMDVVNSLAGLGVTAFYQNDLGTAYGSFAYGYSPWSKVAYPHSGQVRFNYTGLYPVIEADLDFGGRPAYYYRRYAFDSEDLQVQRVGSAYLERPSFRSKIQIYLPLSTSSSGWYRGITPRLSYRFSNDLYDRSMVHFGFDQALEGSYAPIFQGIESDRKVLMHSLSASVTGYMVQAKAPSLEYPRLGVGAELGFSARLALTDIYSAGAYAYLYAYLPGMARTQGMKFTSIFLHSFGALFQESQVNVLPRGFAAGSLSGLAPDMLKCTLDYSIPFRAEFGLGSLFRVTHAVVKPHADLTLAAFPASYGQEAWSLYSAGAEFTFRLANFFWLPFETSIGFTLDLNGGSGMDLPGFDGVSDVYAGMVFNMKL